MVVDCVPTEAASWESFCEVIKFFQGTFKGLMGLAWYLWTKLVAHIPHFFLHTSYCWLAMGHWNLETVTGMESRALLQLHVLLSCLQWPLGSARFGSNCFSLVPQQEKFAKIGTAWGAMLMAKVCSGTSLLWATEHQESKHSHHVPGRLHCPSSCPSKQLR